ncbi:MAG: two-component regulator propeller domain-containing protein [bacterium]
MHRFGQIVHVVFLVLLTTFAPRVQAQYRFDSWTTDNGLPQASVNSILQTRDGFLWFATFGGLVRYDGLRFQVFNPGNTKGLSTGRLSVLFEDREGTLWITTEGQGVVRYKDGIFTTYTTADGLPDNQGQSIQGDENGNVLLQAADKPWRWTGRAFAPYLPAASEPVNRIVQRMPGGAIWYVDGSHLRKFDHGQVTVDVVPGVNVLRAFEDSQGRVWIAASDGEGLLMLKDGKLTRYGAREGFLDRRYGNAMEDRQGRLWFGSNSGLTLFKDGRLTRFTAEDGLARGEVVKVYQDREGTLWVGSTGGLTRVTERALSTYSTQDGLAGENVYPIYEDRQGKIWIGSWPGVTQYQDGKFQNVSARYSDLFVTAFFEDREGNFWIGTFDHVTRGTPDGKVTLLPQSNMLAPRIRTIYQDRAGNLWFGSGRGLFKAAPTASGNVTDFQFTAYSSKDGLAGKEVFVIHEDRQGQLWIGTEVGLTRYKDGRLTPVTEQDGNPGGMVRSIYEDRDGTLWIGMYDKGLYRFSHGKFTHYTSNDGLFDNGAFQIIDDERGNFWISCNLGIYRVRKSELDDFALGRVKSVTSIPYNKRDGMLNSECNGGMQPAGIRARDGRIWFPTQQGVAVINPAAVPFNPQPPPVVIDSLVLDTKAMGALSTVQLQPGQEYLEIHYSGLSFINPELVRFKYKLAGLDADWINADTRRTAYYSHLPPGKYQFTVIAANRDGVWNEQGASIEIVVLPPFWRTWWFLFFAVCSLALITVLFYRRRIAQLELARRTQEAFSNQLIESQERERKRIAAELHDSLGQSLLIIKNRAYLGLTREDDPAVGHEQLKQISDSVSEALQEVREISYYLRPSQLERLGLTTTLEEMLERVATTSDINFSYQVAPLEGAFSSDAEINFFRIVQESINNIIKHSSATEAGVTIERSRESVRLLVQDNGKGFTTHGAGGNGPGPHSFGLIGLAERVRLLGGSHSIQSMPGSGTTVSVTIKIHSNGAEDA